MISSKVHEIDPVHVELEVEVPWERVEKQLNQSYGQLQRNARVRGFRKGKVPRNVVRRLFGSQVKAEVAQELMQESIISQVQEHELPLVASPEVEDLPDIAEGQALSFKARIEVRPKVEAVDTDALEVARPPSTVTDEQLAEDLDRLRDQHAVIQAPDPERPSRENDLLTVTYAVTIDGEEKEEMSAKERVIELDAERLLPTFYENLLGLSVGDTKSFDMTYGDEAPDDLKGQTATFAVEVVELRERVLPDLDDDFAQEAGDHETLEELKAERRAALEEEAQKRAESAVRERLIDKLVEKNPIPVPPTLVKEQLQRMQQELAWMLQMSGGGAGLDPSMFDGFEDRAAQKVRAGLLMAELARLEGLAVDKAEVDAKLEEIAEQTGKHIAKVRVEYGGEKRQGLESRILEDKLMALLLQRATIVDEPPEGEASAEAAPVEEGSGDGADDEGAGDE
jgi:trigger factor